LPIFESLTARCKGLSEVPGLEGFEASTFPGFLFRCRVGIVDTAVEDQVLLFVLRRPLSAMVLRRMKKEIPMRAAFICRAFAPLACMLLGLLASSAAAQPPRLPVNQGIARELEASRAAEVLGVPKSFVEALRTGEFGFESTSGPKERLQEGQLNSFVEQFGRLRNDMPTFQVRPGEFFVLIPLPELERQPAPVQPAANPAAVPAPAPAAANPQAAARPAADQVDHRPGQSPIRNQGQRGTCVAFASCAELEALARKTDPTLPADLSENLAYYWYMQEEGSRPCLDPGLATYKAAGYLQKHLVGAETTWTYVDTSPDDLQAAGKCSDIDTPPSAVKDKPGLGIDAFTLLPTAGEVVPNGTIDIKDTRTLEQLLADGHDIVFGTIVAWNTSDADGVIDVKLGPAGQPIFGAGGHAMVIVGYNRTGAPGRKPYFIVRNSWGTSYGHAGYLYMTYDYIRTYARYGYVTTRLRTGNVDLGQ
jgi:hypothetical protein